MVQIGNRTRHCPRSNGRAVRQPASERRGAGQEAAGGLPHYAECSQAHCSCLLLRHPQGFLSQSFLWMDDFLSSPPCSVPGCGLGPWSTQPLSDPGSSHGSVLSLVWCTHFLFFLFKKCYLWYYIWLRFRHFAGHVGTFITIDITFCAALLLRTTHCSLFFLIKYFI